MNDENDGRLLTNKWTGREHHARREGTREAHRFRARDRNKQKRGAHLADRLLDLHGTRAACQG